MCLVSAVCMSAICVPFHWSALESQDHFAGAPFHGMLHLFFSPLTCFPHSDFLDLWAREWGNDSNSALSIAASGERDYAMDVSPSPSGKYK